MKITRNSIRSGEISSRSSPNPTRFGEISLWSGQISTDLAKITLPTINPKPTSTIQNLTRSEPDDLISILDWFRDPLLPGRVQVGHKPDLWTPVQSTKVHLPFISTRSLSLSRSLRFAVYHIRDKERDVLFCSSPKVKKLSTSPSCLCKSSLSLSPTHSVPLQFL